MAVQEACLVQDMATLSESFERCLSIDANESKLAFDQLIDYYAQQDYEAASAVATFLAALSTGADIVRVRCKDAASGDDSLLKFHVPRARRHSVRKMAQRRVQMLHEKYGDMSPFTIYKNWRHIELQRFNLHGADLSGCILSDSDLSWADLSGANLANTSLSAANLMGADLTGANLSGVKARDRHLPNGEIVGIRHVLCPAKSLQGVKGLPPEIRRALREIHRRDDVPDPDDPAFD